MSDLSITVKNRDGSECRMWMDYEAFQLQQDWYAWAEYIVFKYPPGLMWANPGYRPPTREGEVDSFENWKAAGKPRPALFNYGELIKDEPSEEFVNMIMKP